VPKHVAAVVCVVYTVSQSAFIGKCTDCINRHGVSNLKFTGDVARNKSLLKSFELSLNMISLCFHFTLYPLSELRPGIFLVEYATVRAHFLVIYEVLS
jgi:hypothetical protein